MRSFIFLHTNNLFFVAFYLGTCLFKQLLYCSLYCAEGLSGVISVNVSSSLLLLIIIIIIIHKTNSVCVCFGYDEFIKLILCVCFGYDEALFHPASFEIRLTRTKYAL